MITYWLYILLRLLVRGVIHEGIQDIHSSTLVIFYRCRVLTVYPLDCNYVRISFITIIIPTLYFLICVHYNRAMHSFEVHVEVS